MRMTAKGREDQFPPCQLNARCVFKEKTFAEARSNGRDAPKPDIPRRGQQLESLTSNRPIAHFDLCPS